MSARISLCVGAALCLTLQTQAADLTAIKRVLAKEPAYQGNPRYCLLAFGKEAKSHIWLVRDDRAAYVDRNRNGDLTEPNEKIDNASTGFNVNDLVVPEGPHRNLYVYTLGDGTFRMNLRRSGAEEDAQYVGIGLMERPSWGDRAETAPIIHFDGPMSLARYGPPVTIPRDGGQTRRRYSLRLLVGTPGLGKGTFASYDEVCACNFGAIEADFVFAAGGKKGETLRQRSELIHDG